MNLVSNVLDTPEIFWSEPALEPLYQAIRGKGEDGKHISAREEYGERGLREGCSSPIHSSCYSPSHLFIMTSNPFFLPRLLGNLATDRDYQSTRYSHWGLVGDAQGSSQSKP